MVKHRRIVLGILFALGCVNACSSIPSQTYEDKAWCFQATVPANWVVDAHEGEFAHFSSPGQAFFNIGSDPNEPPVTLAHSLERLKRGSFGPELETITETKVDGEPALWLTLSPRAGDRHVVIVVNPDCSSIGMPLFIMTSQENPQELQEFLKGIRLVRKQ